MQDDDYFVVIGRLYVASVVRDNEIKRLREVVADHERLAREAKVDPPEVPDVIPHG